MVFRGFSFWPIAFSFWPKSNFSLRSLRRGPLAWSTGPVFSEGGSRWCPGWKRRPFETGVFRYEKWVCWQGVVLWWYFSSIFFNLYRVLNSVWVIFYFWPYLKGFLKGFYSFRGFWLWQIPSVGSESRDRKTSSDVEIIPKKRREPGLLSSFCYFFSEFYPDKLVFCLSSGGLLLASPMLRSHRALTVEMALIYANSSWKLRENKTWHVRDSKWRLGLKNMEDVDRFFYIPFEGWVLEPSPCDYQICQVVRHPILTASLWQINQTWTWAKPLQWWK